MADPQSSIQAHELEFVDRFRARLQGNTEFRDAGLVIDWYIRKRWHRGDTCVKATDRLGKVGGLATDIFGCALEYDRDRAAARLLFYGGWPTFTTHKTKLHPHH